MFKLHIRLLHNDTYLASVIEEDKAAAVAARDANVTHSASGDDYDGTGAMYYVIAVVLMYGFSIILMIGSSVKKSKHDHGVRKYMKDLDKIKRLARRQEKFKARLIMYGKRYPKPPGASATQTTRLAEEPTSTYMIPEKENPSDSDTQATSSSMPDTACPLSPARLHVLTPVPDDRLHVSSPGQDKTVTPAYILPQPDTHRIDIGAGKLENEENEEEENEEENEGENEEEDEGENEEDENEDENEDEDEEGDPERGMSLVITDIPIEV